MGEGKNFFPGLAAVDIYILTKGTTGAPGRRPFSPHLRLAAGNLDIREHNIWGCKFWVYDSLLRNVRIFVNLQKNVESSGTLLRDSCGLVLSCTTDLSECAGVWDAAPSRIQLAAKSMSAFGNFGREAEGSLSWLECPSPVTASCSIPLA